MPALRKMLSVIIFYSFKVLKTLQRKRLVKSPSVFTRTYILLVGKVRQ